MPVQYIPKPIKAEQQVIGARAYLVNYQNATLRPIMVVVTSWHITVGAGACRVIGYNGAVNPAGVWQASGGYFVSPIGVTNHSLLSFLVPAGYWYRVDNNDIGGNLSQINLWREIQL